MTLLKIISPTQKNSKQKIKFFKKNTPILEEYRKGTEAVNLNIFFIPKYLKDFFLKNIKKIIV